MIKFTLQKCYDGEGPEGMLSESREWCEAVAGWRLFYGSRAGRLSFMLSRVLGERLFATSVRGNIRHIGARKYELGRHACAALSAQGFFEPVRGALAQFEWYRGQVVRLRGKYPSRRAPFFVFDTRRILCNLFEVDDMQSLRD